MSEVAEVLRAARKTIEDPARWTQHTAARQADGTRTSYTSPLAVCWCADSAIGLATSPDGRMDLDAYGAALEQIYAVLRKMDESIIHLNTYNDTHTHTEVLALLDRAIAEAEGQARP